MSWSDWATVASLATALGTLVLAVATFSAVRSANLTARIAQQSLLVGLRPVLMATRRDDPTQKVNFGDEKWVGIKGGGAVGEVDAERRPSWAGPPRRAGTGTSTGPIPGSPQPRRTGNTQLTRATSDHVRSGFTWYGSALCITIRYRSRS